MKYLLFAMLSAWVVMGKKLVSGARVCFSSFLDGCKYSDMFIFAVVLYLSYKLSKPFIKTNTTDAQLIILLSCFVFAILFCSCFTQIVNSIVQSISINMVNLFFGKFVVFNQPNQSMRGKFSILQLDIPVSSGSDNPSNRPNFDFWPFLLLQQLARLRDVFKHFQDKFSGKSSFIHA